MDRHNIVISHSETKKIVIFKNLYLTDNLTCYREECVWGEPDASKINRNFVSSLIARMYKCEVSELIIPYQNLTLKEFEFLICSGKVTYLNMRGATIVDENGKKLPHVRIQMALYKYHCKLSLSSLF
uniref:Uncharacterized protein n=2 Tax=Panagrolaimus davidi TaxID=227884 RepID=A0A914PYQ7_9BILA